ncbi:MULTISPECIES: DUF4398 domain-containing protein [Methylobacter]|uniref:Uncharacterized protein DUF4398 n=1 Tax=Methylobacter tundripaludum TaxID=173365 RepID=A0A2S6H9T9_9GAMM|nr:DUF4398 domain-containing protein [Methylobacter tundripaludum]PPK74218.1 uncharacterized protein DUF4398 [Methylobacter tundripaludum]
MFTANTFLRSGSSAILTSLLLFLPGCSSTPPKEALSQAETAIQDADRAGASQYEPQLLSSARTKLSRANKEMADEENDEARRMAEEAFSEAVLANAKAEAAKQAKETDDMKKAIQALKQEASRESESQQ